MTTTEKTILTLGLIFIAWLWWSAHKKYTAALSSNGETSVPWWYASPSGATPAPNQLPNRTTGQNNQPAPIQAPSCGCWSTDLMQEVTV